MKGSENDRLLAAVEGGLLPTLSAAGFRIASAEPGNRGSIVVMVAGAVEIRVVADWLEGELDIAVHLLGVPATVLRLRRLSRSVTAAILQSRMAKAANEILEIATRSS